MMSIRKTNLWLAAILLSAVLIFSNCGKSGKPQSISEEYFQYFNGYTTGIISKKGPVRVEFSFIAATPEQLSGKTGKR